MFRTSSLSLLSCYVLLLLRNTHPVASWSTFVVPHTADQDDTPALTAALANFSTNSTILFQKGTTYNIFTPIKFPTLTNVEVVIEGNLTYPTNITAIQNIVASSSYPGAWFDFTGGTNITLQGSTDPNWGWIDGHGQAWWNINQQTNRPHGWAFNHITNGIIRNLKLWKPIGWNFATSGSQDIHIYDNVILAVSDNSSAFPFNTDGFSAGGSNILLESNHVENGDDCVTVGSGAINITVRNSYCANGHGLSIGSLGEGGAVADVENVLFENVVMVNCLYAARFKSWTGGNGLARNITWKNIAFSNVPFPIYVTQNYWDQEDGAKPNSTSVNNTHIEDFLFENFVGTIRDVPYVEGSCVTDPCWYAVTNATGKEVIILDLYPNTTSNILAKDIFAKTETGARVAAMCDPTTISNDVGFVCQDGPFIPTKVGL
ncbi:pectin lyase fold/virulence factor [Lentinula aff. detonsa]|uniref:galacturonan 1,4-alpha-galacturonidase n=1 Tax=Lentinula aff. detonsa TaxID=2804958 RepID=A0AA38KQD2_9AGAR|nr:pectin lyase fold/virulence factor [Lentinula aff. detonsa]